MAASSDRLSTRRRAGEALPLTPEEESIPEPDDDDEIDDTLPADLWFRVRRSRRRA